MAGVPVSEVDKLVAYFCQFFRAENVRDKVVFSQTLAVSATGKVREIDSRLISLLCRIIGYSLLLDRRSLARL